MVNMRNIMDATSMMDMLNMIQTTDVQIMIEHGKRMNMINKNMRNRMYTMGR